MSQLLTPDDVAILLKIKPRLVLELARAGRIPHTRVGRSVRFSESDVDAYIAAGRSGSA